MIKNEFKPPVVIDYDYYVSNYILPVVDNKAEQKNLIDRWIVQCTDQIDVLCGGRVYSEFDGLDLTQEKDQKRAYYLKKAVCSLLEYYIDTGKAFVDKNFSSTSNVPANINASSEDANFEHKRKDIIKLLVVGEWYQTFNTYSNAQDNCTFDSPVNFEFANLVDKLNEIFKRLDNKNSFSTNQVLNNHNISHIKELEGQNLLTSYLRNFRLDNCDISKTIYFNKTGKDDSPVAYFVKFPNGQEFKLGAGGGVEQKQSDWNQADSSKVDFIKNKPTLSQVATSGDYNDLSNKPIIPVVPTKLSAFENDKGFIDNTALTPYATKQELQSYLTTLENYNPEQTQTLINDKGVLKWSGDGPFTYSGLKFTSTGTSTLGYQITGSLPNIKIQYHLETGNWIDWDGSNITLNDGKSVWVRNTEGTLSTGTAYFKFKMTGSLKASGNVNSMINFNALSNYCYRYMFQGCTSLTQAPNLPATTLASSCYAGMFYGCTSLTQAPTLPATTLAIYCYYSMFQGCTSLTQAPNLPATTLAEGCYAYMFYNCTNLKISNSSGTKFFTRPATIPTGAVKEMFSNTGGTYTSDPVANGEYYWY